MTAPVSRGDPGWVEFYSYNDWVRCVRPDQLLLGFAVSPEDAAGAARERVRDGMTGAAESATVAPHRNPLGGF